MGWQRRTFRCWPLLGPTRLEARGSRGAQGDGEQGTQQWPPRNVRRCGRHNTRIAYGQGRSPSLGLDGPHVPLNLHECLSFWCHCLRYGGTDQRVHVEGSRAASTLHCAVLFNSLLAHRIFKRKCRRVCAAWSAINWLSALKVEAIWSVQLDRISSVSDFMGQDN